MRKHQKTGLGRLTWAWIMLFGMLAVSFGMIQLFGSSSPQSHIATLDIEGEPEKFAPEQEFEESIRQFQLELAEAEALPTKPAQQPNVTEQKPSVSDISEIDQAPIVSTATDALEFEGDSATVIRIEDLPSTGYPERNVTKTTDEVAAPSGTPPPAPASDLSTMTADGLYPAISTDGRKPSLYYRRSFNDPADRPRIALIIAGLGLSTSLTSQAINDLPAEVTLAFAPYARDLPQWTNQARNAGHELILELPMESSGLSPESLGPAALLTSRSEAENRQRMNWILARFQGYFGVTNYLGGKFSSVDTAISPVYSQLQDAGVAIIADPELATTGLSTSGLDTARVDLVIGSQENEPLSQLTYVEDLAQERSTALVKIYPTPESLAAISLWAKGLQQKGIVLAPASSMLQ